MSSECWVDFTGSPSSTVPAPWSQSQAPAVTDNNGWPSRSQLDDGVNPPPCPLGTCLEDVVVAAGAELWQLLGAHSLMCLLAKLNIPFDKHLRQAEGHVGFWLKFVSA